MKRIYENPELEVIVLSKNDVVRTSGAGSVDQEIPDDKTEGAF